MDADDYLANDATGLADLVRAGEVSPAELRQAATARHERTDPVINAVVEWYDDPQPPDLGSGLAAADGDPPLAGVPFLRKDFGATEQGRLIEMGSRLGRGHRATTTSTYFERMMQAGVQVLGRTAVPEFAQHGTTESVACGPTRNPLNPATSAGGSSGGAAAAVRAGVVPIAHASDAAGSIRIPSAVTGLIGLKPTRGLVPPPVDDWRGLVVEFVVARSVADVETALDVLAPSTARRAESSAESGATPRQEPWRIALSIDHWAGLANDPAISAAVNAAALLLEAQGHRVEAIERPFDYERLMTTWPILFDGGIADVAQQLGASTGRPLDGDYLEPMTRRLLADVDEQTEADLAAAAASTTAVTAELAANLADFDLLLTPTLDRPTIPLERMGGFTPRHQYMADGDEWFDRLYLANVTGWPAISIPAAANSTDQGAASEPPIGLQFMAPPGNERHLIGIARTLLGDSIVPAVDPTRS